MEIISSRAERESTDVLIVGAGPTGLLAASLLARCGISVRIVDKSPTAAKESRALVIHARTLELLLSLGLAESFLDRGMLTTGARIYVDGRQAAALDLGTVERADSPYPIVLLIPQSEVEDLLIADLDARGVAVERGIVVGGLSQDAAGVSVDAVGPDDGALRLSASYLIGADGAHSVVRKALGLTFEGAPYAQTFLLADCKVEWDLENGPFSLFLHGPDFALYAPLKGEEYGRIITLDSQAVTDPSMASQGSSPATLADVERAFRRATNLPLALSEPRWLSRYRVHHRGVNRYREGRAFVAGDAAHIHSPAGGQGMNTGLQDAANLAWKIALAMNGTAPPALLDSYHDERWPVGEKVLKETDRVFSFMTSQSGWVTGLRDTLAPIFGATIGRSGLLRSRAFHFMSELGIRYHPGGAVAEEGSSWSHGPKAGRRAPDAVIARKTAVFDLLAGYRFHLLALSRTPLRSVDIEAITGEFAAFAGATGLDLGTHLVAHSFVGRDPRLVQPETGSVFTAYGLTGDVMQALYLVRPDGYVAWRAPGLDFAACRRSVAGLFGTVMPSSGS